MYVLHQSVMILFPKQFYFILNVAGEVQFSKNGSTPLVFMHVDQTLQLWAFFDVYGSTQKVRILGSCVEPHHPHSSSGQ
jgi:protein neuralized